MGRSRNAPLHDRGGNLDHVPPTRGTVKSYDAGTGYGFGCVPGVGKDVFLHASDFTGLARDVGLRPGDAIAIGRLRVEAGGRVRAFVIRLLDAEAAAVASPRTFAPTGPVWRAPS
jgi:cold shock CspA family protein